MVRNIIFDLGRVLINWAPKKYMEKVFDKDTVTFFMNNIFNTNDWNLMDKGLIDEEELWKKKLSTFPQYKEEIEHMKNKVIDLLTPIEENVNILYELKKKYKLYVLSNFSKNSFKMVKEKYKFFELFNGIVISSYVNSIKPEEKIYKILIKTYNIIPEESLYIDDKIENISTGKRLGFKTIHLKSPELLKNKLKKYI
ncbi:haloacid dehalogenase [Thermosipho melanesiensis]|uniref:HAD-superfamily hydrolase, subfamily IA, variant 3 n=2 Tax=Thermosipho melanesiensis TaxID=46541 RepID=A6LLG0_THEM4|nr:HAD family phosphatase [Thermosipho melanesiensis]ABR30761.1 HAD-superfamily hydrolase, subfamily IA, variant 3 [Thermosipho melanesiensis BI429]APT73884.1 haloacid dehalogenase [Thermosipho melanesiensis]OOC35825.1 haloacid dehalogenase [Thermosipho melanesiensis]OOC38327.1 haloacid dehalogenase [Thermosipho melanesiensis]OOC38788.1 haloacid dehalogenase [Thermosipho melanesiensis]